MRLLVMLILFIFPFASAIDLGGFEQQDGKIMGKYLPAGLEGKISCYSNGQHIMDIVYKNDSIQLVIHFFKTLNRLVERDPFLKEEIKNALAPINIKGARFTLEYGGCTIELHDVPTRFLRIFADKIVFSNINYEVNKIEDNLVKLYKQNFSATLMSSKPIEVDKNITAYDDIILVSFSHFEEGEKIEEALKEKVIGGEIIIVGCDIKNDTDFISYFGNVTITPAKIENGKIILKINGDCEGGKIIKVNLGKNVCLSDKILIKYDGKPIEEASSFEDILNPDDDGSNPEYYKLLSEDGAFLLITIPHFSEHIISIEFILENIFGKIMAICFGLLIIALATFYIFRK